MATIEQALAEALEAPDHYFGAITELQSQGWAVVFGRHRDSDNLDISNFETVLQDFTDRYKLNDDFRVEGSSHWTVGWTDQLLVRALQCNCEDWEDADFVQRAGNLWECRTCNWSGTAGIRDIFIDAFDFAQRLQNHAVLDEEDYSRREHEDLLKYIEGEIHYATPDYIKEVDFELDTEEIFSYLFDNYSVCHIDDLETSWITEAITDQYERKGGKNASKS